MRNRLIFLLLVLTSCSSNEQPGDSVSSVVIEGTNGHQYEIRTYLTGRCYVDHYEKCNKNHK
jgi:hypothetical protein